MKIKRKSLVLLGLTLCMVTMQSCGAPYAEKQIARVIYEKACGISGFDPCHPDEKWPICGPGESEICQAPTCTGGHVTYLNLSCFQLKEVPPEIGSLTHLETLRIFSKETIKLPAEIGQLTELTTLVLSLDQLTSLPAEIGQLSSLKKLVLYESAITNLPPEIGRLKNLEELDLSGSQLVSLPAEIGQLTALKKLDLNGSGLTDLPSEIGQLTHLEELDLSDNQLTSLPPEIGQLSNLKKLDLSNNLLTGLPEEIGNLENLENLNLADNQISSLQEEIGELTRLTSLSIDRNPLNGPAPEFLTELPLEAFYFSRTGLCITDEEVFQDWRFGGAWRCSDAVQLPETEIKLMVSLFEQIGLTESWNSDITPCRWAGVSCWDGHVRNLQLHNWNSRELTHLPEEITGFSQLESLALDGNKLAELPSEINQLGSLKRLTLNNNQFNLIPPEIVYLPQLEYLDISNNPLEGPIPGFIPELPLWFFYFEDTGLCFPDNESMQIWLEELKGHSEILFCSP